MEKIIDIDKEEELYELIRVCIPSVPGRMYQHIQYSFNYGELAKIADWLNYHTPGNYKIRVAKADYVK